MCKSLNPCCCIKSYWATVLVAIVDVFLWFLVILVWGVAMYNFKDARAYLIKNNIKDDVAWYGIISIPIATLISLWSGLKLSYNIIRNDYSEPSHIVKVVVFFLGEVVGFIAPFYIFDDYIGKIRILTDHSSKMLIFRLLDLNPVTIVLFIYQILSFWVVHHRQFVMKRRNQTKIPKSKVAHNLLYTLTSVSSEVPPGNVNSALIPPTSKSKLYPDLDELRVDSLLTPNHYVINVNCTNNGEDMSTYATIRKPNSPFQELKRKCIRSGTLYEDVEFPPTNTSLGSGRKFDWKRPFEISSEAQFFTDGVSRFDVRQGELGDCWFLAALANLTLNDVLFEKVVPLDNEWDEHDGGYAGICHFRFWVTGNNKNCWKEVIIDDRLPTRDGKLVYLHSSDRNEYWSALLEKAYAKLNGSYAKLDGNDGIGRAMISLTGGRITRHLLMDYRENLTTLFDLMKKALHEGMMLGCCCLQGDVSHMGIYGDHAYSITHVKRLKLRNGKQCAVIRIHNPWGNEAEWNKMFSDRHPIWKLVHKHTKNELQLIFRNDGEFWFPVKELVKYFYMIEICHLP